MKVRQKIKATKEPRRYSESSNDDKPYEILPLGVVGTNVALSAVAAVL